MLCIVVETLFEFHREDITRVVPTTNLKLMATVPYLAWSKHVNDYSTRTVVLPNSCVYNVDYVPGIRTIASHGGHSVSPWTKATE